MFLYVNDTKKNYEMFETISDAISIINKPKLILYIYNYIFEIIRVDNGISGYIYHGDIRRDLSCLYKSQDKSHKSIYKNKIDNGDYSRETLDYLFSDDQLLFIKQLQNSFC
jgi:hypothetical protein